MFKVITNFVLFFIIFFIPLIFTDNLFACSHDLILSYSSHKINLKVAMTSAQQEKGLSGVKSLKKGKGMFFYYPQKKYLAFWMVDTYINLDIFFLDKFLRVIAVERNQKAHPGRKEPPKISRTKQYLANFVLELSSKDPISKKIGVNKKLVFNCSRYFQQTKQGIHLKR